MRYSLGLIIVPLILITILLFTLKIWDIHLFDISYLKNGWLIFILAICVSIILVILVPLFYKPHNKGYDKTKGNIAKPKL